MKKTSLLFIMLLSILSSCLKDIQLFYANSNQSKSTTQQ